MNLNDASRYNEQLALLARLGIQSMPLKYRLRRGKVWQSRQHTCNHGGNCGRAARRTPGWRKHGKGPQNAPNSGRVHKWGRYV